MGEQREADEPAVVPVLAFPEVAAIDNGPDMAPLRVRDVVLDPVFSSRRDALLRTVPLHEIVDSVARGTRRRRQRAKRASVRTWCGRALAWWPPSMSRIRGSSACVIAALSW